MPPGTTCARSRSSPRIRERLLAVVRELGLDAAPNTSVPRALRQLVGFGAPRYAVIDVGTNSVKFHLAERRDDGSWRKLADRAEVTRLGEGLDETGVLERGRDGAHVDGDRGHGRRGAARRRRRDRGRRHRGAAPRREPPAFLDAVARRCGVRIEVIAGDDEARLAYLAATAGLGLAAGPLVVFDTGGGSTQFTFGHGAGRRAVQRRRRRGPLHRAVRARRARSRTRCCARARGDRGRLASLEGRHTPARSSPWAAP